MRLHYCLVAENAIVDQDSDRISLLNVIESVSEDRLPAWLPTMFVITTLWIEQGDHDQDWHLDSLIKVPGSGEKSFPANLSLGEQAVGNLHRVIQQVQLIELREPGSIEVSVKLNNAEISKHVIPVRAALPNTGYSSTKS
jgi:hypothetical protein